MAFSNLVVLCSAAALLCSVDVEKGLVILYLRRLFDHLKLMHNKLQISPFKDV